MLEEEREASDLLIYQMTPSRYGLDLEHLRKADAIEIVVGQGAKPGTGGMLLGMKVSEKVARMRTLPVGVDQRSAVRHPDFPRGRRPSEDPGDPGGDRLPHPDHHQARRLPRPGGRQDAAKTGW
jgi:hypothetical protein